MSLKTNKIPVILYEEDKNGKSNIIPYIEISLQEEMPKVLFISEYKETGEFEPDAQFGTAPVVDMILHQYVDMQHLQFRLDVKTYDKIRVILGMQPLNKAKKEGKKILDKVSRNAEKVKNELQTNPEKRLERTFQLGEDLKNKLNKVVKEG